MARRASRDARRASPVRAHRLGREVQVRAIHQAEQDGDVQNPSEVSSKAALQKLAREAHVLCGRRRMVRVDDGWIRSNDSFRAYRYAVARLGCRLHRDRLESTPCCLLRLATVGSCSLPSSRVYERTFGVVTVRGWAAVIAGLLAVSCSSPDPQSALCEDAAATQADAEQRWLTLLEEHAHADAALADAPGSEAAHAAHEESAALIAGARVDMILAEAETRHYCG